VKGNGKTQKDVLVLFEEPSGEPHEYRCLCGSLLAKITSQGIELKCRKCKRLQIIPRSRIIRTLKQEA
jgi:phage FluMu protein Com